MHVPLLNITLSTPGLATALAAGLLLVVTDRWYWMIGGVLLLAFGVTIAFDGSASPWAG